jgi:hypothetical protein
MTFRAVLFCLFALRSSDAAASTWPGFAAFEAVSEGVGRHTLWVRSGPVAFFALSARRAEAGSLAGKTINTADRRQPCEHALAIPETTFGAQMSCVVQPLQTFDGIVRSARGKPAAKRISALFRTLLRAGNSKS